MEKNEIKQAVFMVVVILQLVSYFVLIYRQEKILKKIDSVPSNIDTVNFFAGGGQSDSDYKKVDRENFLRPRFDADKGDSSLRKKTK